MRYAVSAMSQAADGDKAKGGSRQDKMFNYCDKGGEGRYELPMRLPVCRISSAADSTTLPSLRGAEVVKSLVEATWKLCARRQSSSSDHVGSAAVVRLILHTSLPRQSEPAGSASPAFKWYERVLPDRGNPHLFSNSASVY
jgi:hypothetical protein